MARPTEPGAPARVVLLAGASGSGKSRVARLAGSPRLNLDDFYYDGDRPGLPRTLGIVDWDDAASWDAETALATLDRLRLQHRADVPAYDIATSRRVGTVVLDLDGARCFVAEGIFAPELLLRCRAHGVPVHALYLDRPRTITALLRFVRDVREHRKPVGVLIRRGVALWRAEPAIRSRALAAGCHPVSLRKALVVIGGDDRLRR